MKRLRALIISFNLISTVMASLQGRIYFLYPLDKYLGGMIFLFSVTAALAIHGSYPERHDLTSDFPRLIKEGPRAILMKICNIFISIYIPRHI